MFSKEDLIGDYKWTNEKTNELFKGSPTRRVFDRWNGYQVLFIINAFAALSEHFSKAEVTKTENLITHSLPLDTKSELSVFNWLRFETKN